MKEVHIVFNEQTGSLTVFGDYDEAFKALCYTTGIADNSKSLKESINNKLEEFHQWRVTANGNMHCDCIIYKREVVETFG